MLRLIFVPPVSNTWSNCAENFVSLSHITYFGANSMPPASIRNFFACWRTYPEFGAAVQSEIQHRRVPRCRNTRKYSSTNPRTHEEQMSFLFYRGFTAESRSYTGCLQGGVDQDVSAGGRVTEATDEWTKS